MLGLALAVFNYGRMWLLTPDARSVALIVSIAVFFTVVIAKAIGCTLPLVAKAIRLDPALMASPIITTVVDAASLAILFVVATKVFSITAL